MVRLIVGPIIVPNEIQVLEVLWPTESIAINFEVPQNMYNCCMSSTINRIQVHYKVYDHSHYVISISNTVSCRSLTPWGWVTHICISKLTIIGSDNGLPPGQRQAIVRTNAGILLIGHLGTNFNQHWYIFIQENVLENKIWKMVAILFWAPFY